MKTPTFIENYQTEAFDLCDDLINHLDELISLKDQDSTYGHVFMAGEDTNGGAGYRRDESFNLSYLDSSSDYVTRVHDLLKIWVPRYCSKYAGFSHCKDNMPVHSVDVKVQKTEPRGGFHQWHSEQGVGSMAQRVLTWTLYLNDMPENEAETEFLEYGIKVRPQKGLLCLFPAAWSHIHRGNPPYTKTKYIATGWYLTAN